MLLVETLCLSVCDFFFFFLCCVYDWRSGLPCFHADTATLITFSKTLRPLMAFFFPPPCRHLSLFSVLLSPHLLCLYLLFTSLLIDFLSLFRLCLFLLVPFSYFFFFFTSTVFPHLLFLYFTAPYLPPLLPPPLFPSSTEQTTTVTVATLMAFFKAFTQWTRFSLCRFLTPKKYFSNC